MGRLLRKLMEGRSLFTCSATRSGEGQTVA